jgi:tetratricopeptide (TPR) repeat protein
MLKDISAPRVCIASRRAGCWSTAGTLLLPAILLLVARAHAGLGPGPDGARTMSPDAGLPKPPTHSKRPFDALTSPSAASQFWWVGYELSQSPDISGSQADAAIILLVAAKSLNPQITGVEPLLIQLATHSAKDYSQHVLLWLQSYVDANADYDIVKMGIQYLLNRLGSLDAQRKLLEDLINKIGNRNVVVDSDLATFLGQIMLQQGDRDGAKYYFIQAYRKNRYNTVAFAKLGELAPNDLGPSSYLDHLRLAIRYNPLDMDAALTFGQYAERLQLYDVAAGTYQYCADLFKYLNPTQVLPARIYLPWAIAGYNTMDQLSIPVQVTQMVRNSGRFNLVLEALAGKAAQKAGRPEEAEQILSQAEQKALSLLQAPQPTGEVGPIQMAWFYCFAQPEPTEALDWANRSFAADPNSPMSASLLSYALAMNKQWDLVQKVVQSGSRSQITDLALAQLQVSQGKKNEAKETLRTAISHDPGSFAAEKAKELLAELGEKYTGPDSATLMALLTRSFGQMVVPRFAAPGTVIDAQLRLQGAEFTYGQDVEATVAILNEGQEPLVIGDNSLFTGHIRVDARVSGDLTQSFPNLVSRTVRTQMEVPAGGSVTTSVWLSTGPLRRLLLDHPQASLQLEFTLYLDPVQTDSGAVRCKLADIEPIVVTVKRPAVEITAGYVRSRFNAISSGLDAQKIATALLFTGLLKEEAAMAQHPTALYPYRYADWMPGLLRSALTSQSGLLLGQGPDEWVVKVHTMADMLSMTLDPELATVVARNLSDPKWPVRLMTIYLLSTSPAAGFDKVLDWVAQQDADDLVRSMAQTLRSTR